MKVEALDPAAPYFGNGASLNDWRDEPSEFMSSCPLKVRQAVVDKVVAFGLRGLSGADLMFMAAGAGVLNEAHEGGS